MRRKGHIPNAASSSPSNISFFDNVDQGPPLSTMTNPGGSATGSSTTGAAAYTTSFHSSGGSSKGINFGTSASTSLGAEAEGRSRDGKAKKGGFKEWKRRWGYRVMNGTQLGCQGNRVFV